MKILEPKKPKEASWNFLQCYYAIKGELRENPNLDAFIRKGHKLGPVLKLIEEDDINVEILIKQWYEKSNPTLEKIRSFYKSDKHFLNALKQAKADLKYFKNPLEKSN